MRLDADLTAIDFIRVLEFQDFTQFVDEKQLEKSSLPPLPPGEVVQSPPSSSAPAAATAAKPEPAKAKSKAKPVKPKSGGFASKLAALFPGHKPKPTRAAPAPAKPAAKAPKSTEPPL